MAIKVAGSETKRDPSQKYVKFGISRREEGDEMDELQELFEGLFGGEMGGGEEGEFDWEGLWESFMGEEEALGEQYQGEHLPTYFGEPVGSMNRRRTPNQPFNWY